MAANFWGFLPGMTARGDAVNGRAVFEQCGFAFAYCGHSMETGYEVWLSLSVDHVIPVGSGKLLGYPSEWIHDTANQVTCCRAFNEFLTGYRVTDPPPATVDEFFELRNRHFLGKRDWVDARHARERASYDAAFARPPAEQ